MNEIAGIYHFDGQGVDPDQVGRMLKSVAFWPADRSNIKVDSSVGMGVRQFFITNEDERELLPRQMDGKFLLVADARIDNFSELLRELDLDPHTIGNLTDGYLILKAYERWGEHAPEHLQGDFAFAIWDSTRQRLFCARDAMGVRPFYYTHVPGYRFVFATAMRMILATGVSSELNELHLGLRMALDYSDRESTIYNRIFRLPGGCTLTVCNSTLSIKRYWKLEEIRPVRLSSGAEYAEGLRDVFFDSVRCRMRSAHPIGAQLSGGLDSSSVVCAAAKMLSDALGGHKCVQTFSSVFPLTADVSKAIDERSYQQAVVDQYPVLAHNPVVCDGLDPLLEDLWLCDQPLVCYNYYLDHAMFKTARERGVHVMLTGHDGDAAISHGMGNIAAMLAGLRWHEFYRQCFALSRKHQVRFSRVAWRFGFKPYWDYMTELLHGLGSKQDGFAENHPLINRDFSRRIDLPEVYKRSQYDMRSLRLIVDTRASYINAIMSGLYSFLLEALDYLARGFRLEMRHPFFDRRFIEFSLAMPQDLKLQNGITRYIMHDAMRGVLSDKVNDRLDKSNLGAGFRLGLRLHSEACIATFTRDKHRQIFEYINVDYCRSIGAKIVKGNGGTEHNYMDLFFAMVLDYWLEAQQGKIG